MPQLAMNEGIHPFYRIVESEQDTEAVAGGRKVLIFGSNNYLGLSNHPLIKEAAKKAIDKYGAGCSDSRIVNGTLDFHGGQEAKQSGKSWFLLIMGISRKMEPKAMPPESDSQVIS